MDSILSDITKKLAAQNCVLATVISSTGSTPRSSGAHMLICPQGEFYGTVGGGLIEAQVQITAAEFLVGEKGAAALHSYDLDNTKAGALGMSCGGSLTVLLERLTPDYHAEFVELENNVRKGNASSREAYYVQDGTAWCRVTADELADDKYAEAVKAINASKSTASDAAPLLLNQQPLQYFSETYHPSATVIIAGAGHVAKPTAEIAHLVGFSVVVLDDREEFANQERFPNAHVQVVESLDDILSEITIHKDCYVVIVTRGHEHDKTVLQQALTTPAKYIGMIGSKSKRDGLYERLREEGVTDEAIARCHCPIGLPLGGRTPEEIAVSIMAEIIQKKAQG
ncbi:XdhC family aldehyde oxidoreductase maturation factor [Halodesulfovibrio marinisediminis]|uniref:Xanthine dehydrogenase accessory factor n=1 Tax=Halodesulfovibrio marinisediminis DSM 17456 TaxID=1121457 RepID=A0A1N6GWG0_9BACT|nr:XdhC/CoxI family protein [Halodesulfovibrio marinisediminis]SIO11893.1 xanthine dehydrogenase accessory factor [Halodesulfovibrio marinisediminis DSM 17456]